MKLTLKHNPFGGDLVPLDLEVDTEWLHAEMERTGKDAGSCIAEHLREAMHRSLMEADRVNRLYRDTAEKQ